jgi:hypothetical protein
MNIPTRSPTCRALTPQQPARPDPLQLAEMATFATAPDMRGANDGGPPTQPARPRRELRGRYASQVVYPSMLRVW